MKFAGFEYVEEDIPLEAIDEDPDWPANRKDFFNCHRQQLLCSMTLDGQKDPIDALALGNRYRVVDGHGRVIVAKALGWTHIKARIYATQNESDRSRLREAIRSCHQ